MLKTYLMQVWLVSVHLLPLALKLGVRNMI